MKRVLIVFDSKFGNTERLAREIGTGIQSTGKAECTVINIKAVDNQDFSGFDGVLFGAPIHAFRATSGIKGAVKKATTKGLDGKLVAAFDTYQNLKHKGKASGQIRDMLKKIRGAKLFSQDLSSLVDGYEGPLNAAEPAKAQEFGQQFAKAL
ncbi:MAG: flavodoxin family protein [Candidatus Odinarchaeota archaeon]